MKLTKKELQAGKTITQGVISIKKTNKMWLVRDYNGNWYGFETYVEAKKEFLACIKNAEYLKLH